MGDGMHQDQYQNQYQSHLVPLIMLQIQCYFHPWSQEAYIFKMSRPETKPQGCSSLSKKAEKLKNVLKNSTDHHKKHTSQGKKIQNNNDLQDCFKSFFLTLNLFFSTLVSGQVQYSSVMLACSVQRLFSAFPHQISTAYSDLLFTLKNHCPMRGPSSALPPAVQVHCVQKFLPKFLAEFFLTMQYPK